MNSLYTSPTESPADRLAELIQRALTERVREIVTIEAAKAAAEVEKKIRDETGRIATMVGNRFHFERNAHELVIRVDFKGTA